MPTSLVAILVLLRSLIRSRVDLQLENLALRHQIGVLQRSLKKRRKITAMDRLFWAVAWRRMGFRLFWTWKVRRGQSGRHAIARVTRDLIRRMSRENPTWLRPGKAVGIDCLKGGLIRPFVPSDVAYEVGAAR